MARTQKNKATSGHLGMLKAKLAKFRQQVLTEGQAGSKGGGGAPTFEVAKTGDARVGLVGFPSVGKSTLMTKLTDTVSEVAAYEFTTLTCVPGVFRYKGAKVQLLDLPGIVEGAKDGKGRGRQVIATAFTCSLILIVLDCMKPLHHKRILDKELHGFGIRLNKKEPKITVAKREKGGVAVTVAPGCKLKNMDQAVIESVCREYRMANATIKIGCNASVDDLIDVIEGNRHYCPALYVMNKIDQATIEELEILSKCPNYAMISAHKEWNLDGLIEQMWGSMRLIRVITKPKGAAPDYDDPVILGIEKRTVADFCTRIHRKLLPQFKHALVWGRSVKHQPQRVGKEHVLEDEDIVQIVKKI